jgi:hypothetical protein
VGDYMRETNALMFLFIGEKEMKEREKRRKKKRKENLGFL